MCKDVIEILRAKAKGWHDLANHCLGKGRQEEATENHLRARMLEEAARIVESVCNCKP